MHSVPQSQTLIDLSGKPDTQPTIDSAQLLRGQRTVGIEHGNQHYTLRLTRDNKLILTK